VRSVAATHRRPVGSGYTKTIRFACLVVVAAGLLAGCGRGAAVARATSDGPTGSGSGRSIGWLLAPASFRRLMAGGLPASVVRVELDRSSTFLLEGPSELGKGGRVPEAALSAARPIADFTSATALEHALAVGEVPRQVRWVLLDLEAWSFTPRSEQEAPIPAVRLATEAAHRAGKRLLFAPAVDLVDVVAGHRLTGSALLSAYEREILRPSAPLVDGLDLQLQGLEGTAEAPTVVGAAMAVVEAAHPHLAVWVGLSTNPSGRSVDVGDLLRIVRASPEAAGYWLNVPAAGPACPRCGVPDTRVAIALLERVAGSVPAGRPHPSGAALGTSSSLRVAHGRPAEWILAASQLPAVLESPAVRRVLEGGTVFEPLGPHQRPSELLAVVPTVVFHSEATLASEADHLPKEVRAVLYDNERFADTPVAEQADPRAYDVAVAEIAASHHWTSICDLILPDRLPPAERTAREEVPPCDVIGLNTVQQSERDPARYARLVADDVALVQSVAPGRPVLAGLSANPAGPPVTAAEIAADIRLTRSLVAGYWLNVPSPGVGCPHCHEPDPALLAEALLEAARGSASTTGGR